MLQMRLTKTFKERSGKFSAH